MATATSQEANCSLDEEERLILETEACEPNYRGLVVSADTLMVVDYEMMNLQLYSRHDGKLQAAPHKLESSPVGICLISNAEVAVILQNRKIEILSFKSPDDIKRVTTLDVTTGIVFCDAVTKDELRHKLVVSGEILDMMCWCVVSLKDGHVDTVHQICKTELYLGSESHLAIKNNTVYISCWAGRDNSPYNGVYAYDIRYPHVRKFLYQRTNLKSPSGLTVDRRGFIFVCNRLSHSIHQLTYTGELVTIHTVSSTPQDIFYEDQKRVLYTTNRIGNVITPYRLEYLHQPGVPTEILNMDDRSIQLFEEALKDGKETVHSIRVMVVGPSGVGKTTLVKRLLREEVNISEKRSTEGIDVCVSCCDVSLPNHEWTRQRKDSEQDFRLQRLARVLDEQQSMRNKVDVDDGERTDSNASVTDKKQDKDTEVLYCRSRQQVLDQDLSSTNSQKEESPSALVQEKLTQSETKTMAMLKLLQESADKLKQETGKKSPMTVWDFAGQYAFYTTHQIFLTRRAIYLLVSDVSEQLTDLVADECYFDSEGKMKCKVHELIEVWLNSIHSCAPSPEASVPPVILVGTHVDKISQGNCHEICEGYFREIRSYLKDKPTRFHLTDEDFAIDNTVVDRKLEDLKRKIKEVVSQQPYWGEEIPARWILLEQELMRRKAAGVKVISLKDVENINKEGTVPIEKSEELDLFLRFLHETGTIIYFSIEVLRENIVLDPTWLIDALKSLINAQPNLPKCPADNDTQSGSPADSDADNGSQLNILADSDADNGSQLNILADSDADNGSQLNILADSGDTQKWSDLKEKGILTLELVDAVWTKKKHPELYAYRDHILLLMQQLNIIAKPRAFSEIDEKEENYFLTPCMLRQESPREVITPEQDPRMVSTPLLRYVFTGKYLPAPIFHRLLAACVARWPVAKKKETSENLIFCGCCVFNLDLFHRLTLHFKNHIVSARITRMVIDEVKTPDANLCSRVRRFITLNLSKITSYLGQNLQYELRVSPPCQMWLADEGHDPDAPIMPEHMNHARLCIALVTVCGNALREILLTKYPAQYKDIYDAILANKVKLTRGQGRPLLNPDQIQLVFPDPQRKKTGTVDQFDLSLLYTLIRNISTVPAPITDWGNEPDDQPRDITLGASVERIRLYRNHISGHCPDGKISRKDLEDYWNKFEAVLHDIEAITGGQVYSQELEKQKRQVYPIRVTTIVEEERLDESQAPAEMSSEYMILCQESLLHVAIFRSQHRK